MAVFAVTTRRGPRWHSDRGIREQPGWDEHAAYFDELVRRGVVMLGGPIGDDVDDDVGLLAVETGDERDVRSIFSRDPWATKGILRLGEIRPWSLWLDGRGS